MVPSFQPWFEERLPHIPLGYRSHFYCLFIILGFILLYNLLHAIYSLFFHPLASFPGPRRAALSRQWIYKLSKTGQIEQELQQLHQHYGTRALRIAPNELHITDPMLYHTIYSQRHTFLKDPHFYGAFNTPHSVFVEVNRELHQARRKLLSNSFSKASIRGVHDVLYSKVSLLCDKLATMKQDKPVHIYQAFRCMTVDFISEMAFGRSLKLLDTASGITFGAPFLQTFDLVAESIWDFMYMPVLRLVVNIVPPAIAAKLSASAAQFQDLIRTVDESVRSFRKLEPSKQKSAHEIIFTNMVHLDDRLLLTEAMDILVAGSDTTATTLATALEEMIRQPRIFSKLKMEIKEARLETSNDYELKNIEQLPYLSACVREAIRCAMAVPGRLPRIVPPLDVLGKELFVDGKRVPSGTSVGISAYSVHHAEEIWGPDASKFNPERWMRDEAKTLDKYLVSFSKGARQCLGINLAYAELTMSLAMLANRFHFTLDETLSKADLRRIDSFTLGFSGTGLRVKIS